MAYVGLNNYNTQENELIFCYWTVRNLEVWIIEREKTNKNKIKLFLLLYLSIENIHNSTVDAVSKNARYK